MKRYLFIIFCTILICCSHVLKSQTMTSEYRLANKITIGGTGGWDYLKVDEETGRIFVSHSTQVHVVSEKDGKLISTIPDTRGVHGIAIAPDLNKAFISNGRDSSVTVIDLKTLTFLTKVGVTGQNPDAILYDPLSHNIFVFNGRSANSTVIDGRTNKVLATIMLDGKPENAVSDGKGTVYVNIEDESEITVISSAENKVIESWSISPGEEPTGLALDNENHRLFSVCGNRKMVIVDAVTGKIITSIPIGEGCDGVAFDPTLKRAYSSNGDGTMTVVQEITPDSFRVVENFNTLPGARTIALDTKTHHIFMSVAEYERTEASANNPNTRPAMKPDSFMVLDIAPVR